MTSISARPGAAAPRARAARRAKAVKTTRRAALNATGLIVALLALFPIFWMISTAFKPATEIYSLTPHPLPAHPTTGNFSQVISGRATGTGLTIWTFFRNSLLITVSSVVLASALSLLAAVAVARFRFRLRRPHNQGLVVRQRASTETLRTSQCFPREFGLAELPIC